MLNSSLSKTNICRWNFDAIYISSRNISTSGLGGHIAISGCRLLSQSHENIFELAVVGKVHIVSTVTTILILDLICNISQHDHKISPV